MGEAESSKVTGGDPWYIDLFIYLDNYLDETCFLS